ncbi:hypothetical protein Tco_0962537 [Tanacetum coccineum]
MFSLPDHVTMESKLKPLFDVKRDTSIVFLKCMDTKLDRAESKVEKTEYLLHELYQKKFAESEPSAIEELDKSIYDCQVALGECITKVEVLRKAD